MKVGNTKKPYVAPSEVAFVTVKQPNLLVCTHVPGIVCAPLLHVHDGSVQQYSVLCVDEKISKEEALL